MGYLDQSAFAQSPASTGLNLSTEIIVCTPHGEIAEYQGTRAALEAEGVIPDGTEWPEGFDSLHWEDGSFNYWLRRERPEGIKGPRKQFLTVDWWMFRCNPATTKSFEAKAIERKAQALKDEIYRQSTKAQEERNKQWNAYWIARKDEEFQAFKAIIPGLVRPKRSRRQKTVEQSQGAAA